MPKFDIREFVRERLGDEIYYRQGRMYYFGRHVIHNSSRIDGGVSLDLVKRAAFVVDYKECPELRRLYKKAKSRASVNGSFRPEKALEAVFDTVKEALPNQSHAAVERLCEERGVEDDGKIIIDFFIEEGIGDCVVDSLTGGLIVERFIENGLIGGRVNVLTGYSYKKSPHMISRHRDKNHVKRILDIVWGYPGIDGRGRRKGCRVEDIPKADRRLYERFIGL